MVKVLVYYLNSTNYLMEDGITVSLMGFKVRERLIRSDSGFRKTYLVAECGECIKDEQEYRQGDALMFTVFSNFSVRRNHLEVLIKHTLLHSTQRVSNSEGLEWGRICILKFTGPALALGSCFDNSGHKYKT